MKGKVLKRTLAAVMSLVIVGGAVPLTGGSLLPFTPLTASAAVIEDDHISYDMSTGKLTLKGIFNKEIWNDYKNNELKNVVIRSVYAEEGMVLPSDCSSMFYQFEYLESVDLHNADARTVKDMSKMFWKCGALKTLDMSNLDTSQVTNMEAMFFECFKLNSLNISGFDTGNVTNMELMFCSCKSLTTLDLSGFDTSNVTNMVSMFNSCSALESLNISSFDTSNVTDMNSMFCYSSKLNLLDLSSFDTQNVTSMKYMFEKCSSLTTIYVSNGWKTPSNQPDIFSACTSLVGGQGTVFDGNNTGSSYAHIDGGTSNPGYFTYKKGFESLPFDETTGTLTLTGKIKKAQLDEYRNDTRVKNITADATAVLSQNCAGLFDGFSAECIDLSNVDTTNVTDMSQMFFNCSSLKAIFVSDKWVTAPSTSRMFLGCDSLVGGNGTKYYSTQTNGTYACIDGKDGKNGYFSMHCCTLNDFGILWLRGNINRYDLDNYRGSGKGVTSIIVTGRSALLPTDCSGLFKDFPDVEYIGLLGTDPNCNATQYVTNMSEMCSGCSNLTEFDMSYCDTSKVTDMSDMFCGCKALTTLDFSEINTSALKDTSGMFFSCKQLTELDLSSFDTRNVTNMVTMFSGCAALKTITVGDFWSLESERNSTNMFRGCTNLVGGIGTKFSTSHTNSLYARIDTVSEPGYLTANYPVVISNSMTLGGSIGLNFYIAPSGLTEANLPKTYVVFDVNGKQQKVNIDLNKMNGKKTGYGFNCKLNSISMADDVKATIHYFDANGVEKTYTKTATCEQYLRKFNEQLDGGTKLWELIKGINDYGYYMQKYLSSLKTTNWVLGVDHKPMELAFRDHAYYNSNKAEYIKEIKDQAKSFGTNKNIKTVNYSLVLDSDTAINFKIRKVDGYTGKFTVTVDGKSVTPKKLTDGRFQVTVAGIPAHKLNEPHTVKVTTDSGTTTYKASAISYLYECISKPNSDLEFDAMCAMYEYYKATVAYKNS